MEKELTPKMKRFARLLFEGKTAYEAYVGAYDTETSKKSTIQRRAFDLSARADVKAAVASLQKSAETAVVVTAAMVMDQWWKIATADAQDIVTHRRVCCRYCHGTDHSYQWIDESEWAQEVGRVVDTNRTLAADRQQELPGHAGGFGYNATVPPHETCPKCFGEGYPDIFIVDTRKLPKSSGARMLFNGVKMTRNGPEVVLRDRDAALANIARHLGMFNDRLPGGANGNPLQIEVVRRIIVDPKEAG